MDNEDSQIKKNPSLAKMNKQIEDMSNFLNFAPFLEGIGLMQKGTSTKLSNDMRNIKEKYQHIASVPDEFNSYFGSRGWVASESFSMSVMEKSISLANNNSLEEAEKLLIEHHTDENLKFFLNRMRGIEAWSPRIDLAEKALEDHIAGRYHASIPVVLSLMDGLVNDLEPTGMFAESTDLSAWDSVAGHDTGLKSLAILFRQARKKTTSEKISIPYRNGILHGRDLGYANKTVSVKTWAALFVVADWARRVQQGFKKDPGIKEQQPTWKELFSQISKNESNKKLLEKWKPRNLKIGEDILINGPSNIYGLESPERTCVEFFENWAQKNYGKMAILLKEWREKSLGERAGVVRNEYRDINLNSFELLEIEDKAPAISQITALLTYEIKGIEKSGNLIIRMISEDKIGQPTIRGAKDASWKLIVTNLSSLWLSNLK